MAKRDTHITKQDLTDALKDATQDICETLNARIDGVDNRVDSLERKVDAHHIESSHILKEMKGMLKEALASDAEHEVDITALEKRLKDHDRRLSTLEKRR